MTRAQRIVAYAHREVLFDAYAQAALEGILANPSTSKAMARLVTEGNLPDAISEPNVLQVAQAMEIARVAIRLRQEFIDSLEAEADQSKDGKPDSGT